MIVDLRHLIRGKLIVLIYSVMDQDADLDPDLHLMRIRIKILLFYAYPDPAQGVLFQQIFL
jgi:hypothetical protein